MLAIGLALGTSVAYGIANFLAPVLLRRHAFAAVLLVGQLAALAGSVALLAVAGGAVPSAGSLALAALAGLGNAAGLAFFYEAVRFGPLSVVAPVGATAAVLPVVVGIAGGDALSAPQVAGIVLAIGGAAMAARRTVAAGDDAAWDLPRSIALAAVSAVGLGVLLTALPGAVEDGGLFWVLLVQRITIVVCFLVLIRTRGQTFARPEHLPVVAWGARAALVAPGLLLLAGTLMYALASERGQLSVVAVCGSLFTLVTVGLAIAFLGERPSRFQASGIAAAVLGVCLIAL